MSMVTGILYLLVGLLAAALLTQGARLVADPSYRSRIFDRRTVDDRRLANRFDRFPGFVRWLTEPDIRALRAETPEGLKRSGWYLLSMGGVMGVAWLVSLIAVLVR